MQSRENSTIGTDLSSYEEPAQFLSVPKVRPLQLPFRYKSSSPPSCRAPRLADAYSSAKNSVLKRRQQMSTNNSLLEDIHPPIGLFFEESPPNLREKKSEGMAQVASRSSGASAAVQSDNYF